MQTCLDSIGYPALTPTMPLKKTNLSMIDPKETSKIKSNKSSTNHIFEDAICHPSWSVFSWDGFHLPGQSEPYRTCGQWGVTGCLNSHLHKKHDVYLNAYQKNCSRSVCCMCVESWANKESNRAVRRHVKRMKSLGGKPSHVVFSPPPNSISWDFKTIDKEFKKISKKIGVTGASVIFHPARFHNEKMVPYASPHFHTIAYGWFDGNVISEIAKSSGWTVKKIRTIKNEGEIFATIKYLLSHIKRSK